MGSICIIWLMIYYYVSLSPLLFSQGFAMQQNDVRSDSFDDTVHDHARSALNRSHTGKLYDVSLPSNFSGMEASVVRLRTGSFWARGADFSVFHIPPRILPIPFAVRLDVVYQNLGNWSSYYYNVPDHMLVTDVVGLRFYSGQDSGEMVNISVKGEPILVRFPNIPLKDVTLKCVQFGINGTIELTNMTMPNTCTARDQGHFSVVVPSPAPPEENKKDKLWKWWVVGFGAGVGGLVLFGLLVFLVCKMVRVRKLGSMERETERSEALDTIWVGRSKMPSATGIRTQPVLENEYVP